MVASLRRVWTVALVEWRTALRSRRALVVLLLFAVIAGGVMYATPKGFLTGLAQLQGLSPSAAKTETNRILNALNLADRASVSIRSLSHGMRKRLMAAQCFLGDPELVLLDEPMNGLDPEEAQRMRNLILAHAATSAVVVSSHNLGDLERFCTHVAFARDGRVVKTVRLADLAAAGTTLESEYFQIERSLTEGGRF